MFSPRGTLPPRPRGPHPAGAKPPGSFRGGGAGGLQRKPSPGAPQGMAPRSETPQWTGSQRINVRVTLHRPDPRKVKEKSNLHQEQKGDPRGAPWDAAPCPAGPSGQKPRLSEQSSSAQSRYTPESASSILASFGLSNEDLEELSRYPDEQLTPENMPLILREIRIRKMGPPSRGEEAAGGTVKSKVIDYGHASKYGYTEDPLEVRPYRPEGLPEEPLDARVYNPEAPGGDAREEFQREQNVPPVHPPSGVACNPVFPVEELLKPAAFQTDSSAPRAFYPADAAGKVPGICAGLAGVKAVSQPVLPPVLPPMLPPMLPPLAQPSVPPVGPPLLQQPVAHPVLPPMPQPPFPAEIPGGNHQERAAPRQPGHGASGPKPFRPQAEEPFRSPFGIVKASWLPVFPQPDSQKIKRFPTPSMMNDYYATSPRIFPHLCSLCNVECTHMKDWILHQNTPAHIESCRHLRQQYPDWNPEAHSSKRNAGERKENQTPRQRCSSASPRRSRGRFPRRSRSRSPPRARPRPRSRSPRQLRRFSPRHRSRSPQRSRNPLRTSPRPQRASSSDWARRATRSQDRKAALEAVVKSLGPGFVAEFNKHKSLQGSGQGSSGSSHRLSRKTSGNTKKPLKTNASAKASKKDEPGSSSSSPETEDLPQGKDTDEEEEEAATGTSGTSPASYNRLLRKELLSCGTVLQISDLPDDGFSDQDIKKIVQPFGKVSDLIVLRSRNEAFLEMNYKEAVIAAVKFGETVPVLVNGKRVKISVAEKPKAPPGQAKMNLKKKPASIKKGPSSKKDPISTSKRMKPVPGKKEKRKKPTLAGGGKSKKTSDAAESVDEGPQPSAEAPVGGEGAELLEPWKAEAGDGATEPEGTAETPAKGEATPENPAQVPQEPVEVQEALVDQEATVTTTRSEEPTEPAGKELEDVCVVLISNLPERGCSLEEISNLAKPFGGVRDLLILSSHRKAYLEIHRKSADSMVKFYTCFPMSLDGNQLCIHLVPQCQTVRDEEAIFTALIRDSDPQVDPETVHHQFVHLGNLPDDGYRELEAVCVGLRFGKVDNYVVLKNKNKAILQLDSAKAARSMYRFLQQYPYNMGEHTLSCSLSPNGEAAEAEAGKKEAKKEEPSKASSVLTQLPEASGLVQPAAAAPPPEPSVAKQGPDPISCGKSQVQPEPCESQLEGALGQTGPSPAQGTGDTGNTGAEDPQANPDEAPPCSVERAEESQGGSPELLGAALAPPPQLAAGEEEDLATPSAEPLLEPPRAGEMPPNPHPASAVPAAATGELEAPGQNPLPGAVRDGPEVSPSPPVEKQLQTGLDVEEKLGVSGEVKAEEPVPEAGGDPEGNLEKPLVQPGMETEGEAEAEAGDSSQGSSTRAPQKTGLAQSDTPRAFNSSPKEHLPVGKTLLRAVVSLPDIAKSGLPAGRAEHCQGAGGQQKPLSRLESRGQAAVEKKTPVKEADEPRAAEEPASQGDSSSKSRASRAAPGAEKGGNGRNSAQQDKDSRVDSRAGSKPSQEGESRAPSVKKAPSSTKVSAGGTTKASRSSTGSSVKQKEEEELFPFNLDEFVTVDEVVEESEPPVRARRNPPRAKRKEAPKATCSSEPSSKRRKGKSSVENELSFVTLDEIGEEEDSGSTQLLGVAALEALSDPQGLVVVDEVLEEEELLEAGGEPRSLLTLDELCEQEELGARRGGPGSLGEEQDLKAEPLVTVDEIGEVEELPLREPTHLDVLKQKEEEEEEEEAAADVASFQVPEDPGALLTVDELQEEPEDTPLLTLDEVNEEEEDFLADFNRLKEELNFVTVDEVGEEDEEEESPAQGEALAGPEGAAALAAGAAPGEEDVVAVAGPEEMAVLGDLSSEGQTVTTSKPRGDQEAESQQKKTAPLGVSKPPSTTKALDYLVPKAGFFCQICSLFYSDESSVKNHCRSPLHQQNMEKFMAQQQQEEHGGDQQR